MSATYTVLNQGQGDGDDRRSQPSENHSSKSSAPMAKAEADNVDGSHEEERHVTNDIDNGASNVNVPHIAVTDTTDSKSNLDDHYDGHLHEADSGLHLRDYRPGTPHSSLGRQPHLNFDTELGSLIGDSIPDINVYQHKKTLAQGMMDLALFSANANQLRYVLDSYSRHPYYWPSLVCLVLSLGLQVAIGIGLTWNALYNVKDEKEICIANKINNFTVIGIFLVVVVNVFISAFGVAEPIAVPVPATMAPVVST